MAKGGLFLWLIVSLTGAASVAAAPAAAPAVESWPCDSAPKPVLRAAEIWAPAGSPAAQAWHADATLARLVEEVAPRSVDLVDAGRRLARFADSSATPDLTRARLAAGLIDTIDAERRTIIAGIRRFNGRQAQLAQRIEQGYAAVPASPEAGAATEQVQWDTRIFEDRQRMLPLVCRQPGALETRLMALIAALRAPPGLPTQPGAAYLVYATNEGSGDVSIVDPGERREIGRIPIGKRPRGLVASPDGSLLYVAVSGSPIGGPGVDESKLPPADKAADGIVVIDLATGRVLRTLRGISDPEQIAISPDGSRLYVASEDSGKLIVIGTDGAMLGSLDVGGEPEGVTVSADGRTILTTSEGDNNVAIVSGTPPAVIGRVGVGERPRSAVFLDDRRIAVPGEFDASVSIVDLASRKRLRTIKLGKEDRPMSAARLDPHTLLLTTGRGRTLLRLDVDAPGDAVTGTAIVGPRPWGLALAPDAALAFTANGASDDVSIVDPRTMSVIAKVPVGSGPWGVRAVASPMPRR